MAQTATNTEMKTFPAPLLRLILSGGGGLPPAYGPVIRADGQEFVWDGKSGRAFAVSVANGAVISDDLTVVEGWRLLLDGESPWLDRLAMVAAWMVNLSRGGGNAVIYHPDVYRVWLQWCAPSCGTWTRVWATPTGEVWRSTDGAGIPVPDVPPLPTLSARLANRPPEVALVLALHDVPKIRARVEAAVR